MLKLHYFLSHFWYGKMTSYPKITTLCYICLTRYSVTRRLTFSYHQMTDPVKHIFFNKEFNFFSNYIIYCWDFPLCFNKIWKYILNLFQYVNALESQNLYLYLNDFYQWTEKSNLDISLMTVISDLCMFWRCAHTTLNYTHKVVLTQTQENIKETAYH